MIFPFWVFETTKNGPPSSVYFYENAWIRCAVALVPSLTIDWIHCFLSSVPLFRGFGIRDLWLSLGLGVAV